MFQDNLGFVEAAKTCDSAGYHLAYEIDQEAARSGDNIKCRLLSTWHYFLSPLKETIFSTIHMVGLHLTKKLQLAIYIVHSMRYK